MVPVAGRFKKNHPPTISPLIYDNTLPSMDLSLLLRCCAALLFPIFAFFSISFLSGFFAIFVGDLSISSPIPVASHCKIVSSSVDLRSSKVCELGLLNYKAKHVFYPYEKSKFRCRYDYYWASIFKVQYKDQSSGQTHHAMAEAPDEALPLKCRPDFGAAWFTKDKFKVNKTYECWYTSGISKVTLYDDDLFSCQAKHPSTFEMINRYIILSFKIMRSWFSSSERVKYWRWETIAGVLAGFSTSLLSVTLIRILQQMKSLLPRLDVSRITRFVNPALLMRVFFLCVYTIVMGWVAIQYGKRLGLDRL